jgi:hypothetical protein
MCNQAKITAVNTSEMSLNFYDTEGGATQETAIFTNRLCVEDGAQPDCHHSTMNCGNKQPSAASLTGQHNMRPL